MNKSKDINLSKSLSWLLRHGAVKEGLSFDEGGFIDVSKILNLKQFKKFNIDDITKIVECNDKKRFSLRRKDGVLQIRANQGHSLPVEESGLVKSLDYNSLPLYVYHGTYKSKLKSIKENGLSKMNHNHIHFVASLPGEGEVISGMRKNCDAIVVVDARRAFNDGFKFYMSENGVILCPGNEHDVIPSEYFKEIL